MDVYLPIANLSVNALVIVLLGLGVGLLSGMFGVGGGFLTTPLLIVYGIPPTVAAASSASQVTGASVSGMFAHLRRGGVDIKMGMVLVAGGVLGSLAGAVLFNLLQKSGQIDTVIAILYVLMLGSIGGLMLHESVQALYADKRQRPRPARRRHHPLVAALPFRWRFYRSGLYISPLAPLLLGFGTGMLTILLGVGGGFILVPAMLYLLGMATQVVVGTSLFQILFVTAAATLVHATTTKAVDIVLAALLLLGSVIGAQLGAQFAQKTRPEYLRLALAVIVLLVGLRMLLGLAWRPDEIYSVRAALVRRALLFLAPLLLGAGKPVLVPDVSERQIEIAYSFTGAELLLFGAILYPGGRVPAGESPADIVVVIEGPLQPIQVREKAKVMGVWINADRMRYRSAPSFYALASSKPIDQLVDARTRAIYELGLDSLQLSPASGATPDDQHRFDQGLVDLRKRAGLYFEAPGAVEIRDGVLYRARLTIPARVPVGRYTAETFLIRDGRVLAAAVRTIDIRKSGFERFVARAADKSSLLYGLVAVALSLLFGWQRARCGADPERFVAILQRFIAGRYP